MKQKNKIDKAQVALDIMNEFMTRPLDVAPFPYDEYWLKKVGALCDQCSNEVALRVEVERLRSRIDELTKEKAVWLSRRFPEPHGTIKVKQHNSD